MAHFQEQVLFAWKGRLHKLNTALGEDGIAQYFLDGNVLLNAFVGKKISLEFTGKIFCQDTGLLIKKSFGEGYSYEAFMRLASCDTCIVKPELCHYHLGTCREPQWGENHCFKPHIVYLSLTDKVKVGITRKVNIPHRFIDQGAVAALPILEVSSRLAAGQIEVVLAKQFASQTSYQKMLKEEITWADLPFEKEQALNNGELEYFFDHDDNAPIIINQEIINIKYPILQLPKKVTSLSLDKMAKVEGTLLGIKGQYFILDNGVLNVRKHAGYEIDLTFS